MVRWKTARVFVVWAAVTATSIAAGPKDTLSRARQLYNSGEYDSAIEAALEAGRAPEFADAATLVLARTHLERFRRANNAADLSVAREALKQVKPAALSSDDRVELAIALGESLYFDDRAGAAAEQFELALARADPNKPVRRERLLDWWASALDRQAHLGHEGDAHVIYGRILARMELELRRDAGSPVASYWLVAAARGSGDVARAWDAAIAAWVRTPRGEPGAELRKDLDRIVMQAIIPERARQTSPGDPQTASAAMRGDWERFKQAWVR